MELRKASAQAWRLLLARFPASGASGESGVFSCGLCAFKTQDPMGAPDWGKFQPVGSFEMEVTPSGLKKNCQAGPPGLGWPLGFLCWPPGPSPPGLHPAEGVYGPNKGALNGEMALLARHQAGTPTQAQVHILRLRAARRGPGRVSPSQCVRVTLWSPM